MAGRSVRRRFVFIGLAGAVLTLAAVVTVAISSGTRGSMTDPSAANGSPAPSSRDPQQAPDSPPAAVCDSESLNGPTSPPAGAVTVTPDRTFDNVVAEHSAGTTYWLAPGTHRLSPGEYIQIIPKDGDKFVGAPGAVLDGGGDHRYAFGGHATGVAITHLTVQNFGEKAENNNEGVVNHDSASEWRIESSTIQRNAGAGVMVGSNNSLIGNCLRDNGQYGFSAYHVSGVRDVVLEGNEITGNNTDDWEARIPGCGCTGGGKFWATNGATVTRNYVHDNRGVGLWADTNNVAISFRLNYILGNDAEGIMYETSYNAEILNNTFIRNAVVKGPTNPGFPAAAIYVSESGSDPRVPGPHGEAFLIAGNKFIDNWSGVIAWENADRFAGSPANTSTESSTLVNPEVATLATCGDAEKISEDPYYDDCRWKTQNLLVERNHFEFDRDDIPGCEPASGCGFNGLFSNFGTYPDWSPYKGTVVEKAITLDQNNLWRDNTYVGDWEFMADEAGKAISWDQWRAAPLDQDSGSRMN